MIKVNITYTRYFYIRFCLVQGPANQTQVRYDPAAEHQPTDSSFRKIEQKNN